MADVILTPAAEADYAAARAWYQARSPRAAAGFETAFDRAVEFIAAFPEASPLADDRHRYCALTRYPYGLVYHYDGATATVIAVPHAGQLPRGWGGG